MTAKTVTYYKCDRCRKRFRHKGDVRKLRFEKWMASREYYDTFTEDLCEECQESFLLWLRGGE